MWFFRQFRIVVLIGLAGSTGLPQAPNSQPKRKAEIREIRATGCVRKMANGCLVLKTLDGSSTYTFLAAPKPDSGTVITIQGTPHTGASQCRQGMPLDLSDWEPTDQQCAE